MAWDKYFIVITNQPEAAPVDIMALLKLEDYIQYPKTELGEVRRHDGFLIGTCLDNILISAPDLVQQFFEEPSSDETQRFLNSFLESDVFFYEENSHSGFYGYGLVSEGQAVRLKNYVSAKNFNGIDKDIGELLLEEKLYIEEHSLNKEQFDRCISLIGERLLEKYLGCNVEEAGAAISMTPFIKARQL